ncbi:MAG TPA: hypothetical protein VFV38_08975 [Ktedonobacteraceae bacterium]|nr:hypothetical protein [Ktedonobacteraceae bacterium]
MSEEVKKPLHWLIVGYVSPKAQAAIERQGGRVDEIDHEPPFVAVGLPDNPDGYWSWSHGERQHRAAIEFWNTGDIQMEHLNLRFGPRPAEYNSAHETYLLDYDEDFDETTRRVKPEEPIEEAERQPAPTIGATVYQESEFDPFLASDDLP